MLQREIDDWARGKTLVVDEGAQARMHTLLQLWKRYAGVMNLTASVAERDLGKHVLDGLDTAECAVQAGVPVGSPWLDVGSGGGFPGLVLAALGFAVVLVEPRERRAAFLELALAAIRAKGSVRRGRFDGSTWEENLVIGDFTGFGAASARAVFDPLEWLSQAEPLGATGCAVLVHGKQAQSFAGWRVVASVAGELGIVAACRKD